MLVDQRRRPLGIHPHPAAGALVTLPYHPPGSSGDRRRLVPMPETREALGEFVGLREPDVEELLDELRLRASEVVPELIGLSLGLAQDGLTFTLVASDSATAVLDAMQYVDGGPCVEVTEGRLASAEVDPTDPLDEERWTMYARVGAAAGVGSSLSLPIYRDGDLVAGLNLYASTPGAFAGRHQELADALGSRAVEAVSNADLSFSTRLEAARAPQQLKDRVDVDTAIGLIAAQTGASIDAAQRLLDQAAARAGVHAALVARILVLVRSSWPSP
jgi:GAF domain-containing protein